MINIIKTNLLDSINFDHNSLRDLVDFLSPREALTFLETVLQGDSFNKLLDYRIRRLPRALKWKRH